MYEHGKAGLPLISHAVTRTRERYPPSPWLLLTICGSGRPGPGVMGAKELVLPLTSCSTWKSGPCILPGKHSRADPGGRSMIEQTLRTWALESCPVTCLPCGDMNEGEIPSLVLCHPWKTRKLLRGHLNGIGNPAPHLLQLRRVEPALCLGCTVELSLNVVVVSELAPGHEHGTACSVSCLLCGSIREGESPPLPFALITCGEWESWSCPSSAAHLGEQTPPLSWAAQ